MLKMTKITAQRMDIFACLEIARQFFRWFERWKFIDWCETDSRRCLYTRPNGQLSHWNKNDWNTKWATMKWIFFSGEGKNQNCVFISICLFENKCDFNRFDILHWILLGYFLVDESSSPLPSSAQSWFDDFLIEIINVQIKWVKSVKN